MGRGKDKTIRQGDLKNMSPGELNNALVRATSIKGTAVVRKSGSGNVVYGKHSRPGRFNEDNL